MPRVPVSLIQALGALASAAGTWISVEDGLGKFMHRPGADHTQEGFGANRSADLAGMYGPYQIPQFSRSTDHGAQIDCTMSTWNPYQVVLMTVDIPVLLE